MRQFLFTLALVNAAFAAYPQEIGPRKAAWDWSQEERLAARFDRDLLAKRRSVYAADQAAPAPRYDFVDGHRNPELFLPIELFTALLRGVEGDASSREAYRESLRQRILTYGFDDQGFWRDLESATADYRSLAARYLSMMRNPATSSQIPDVDDIQSGLCYARVSALANARAVFGQEEFDRFLYSAVAPDLSITSAHSGSHAMEHLRFLARGCR